MQCNSYVCLLISGSNWIFVRTEKSLKQHQWFLAGLKSESIFVLHSIQTDSFNMFQMLTPFQQQASGLQVHYLKYRSQIIFKPQLYLCLNTFTARFQSGPVTLLLCDLDHSHKASVGYVQKEIIEIALRTPTQWNHITPPYFYQQCFNYRSSLGHISPLGQWGEMAFLLNKLKAFELLIAVIY